MRYQKYETELKLSTACALLLGAKNGNAAGRKYDTVLNDVNLSPDSGQNQTLRNACIAVNNRPVSHRVNAAADAWFFDRSHVHATF